MINVTAVANSYGTFLYLATGLIGFLMFGRTVDVDSNIIINVGRQYDQHEKHWESFLLRILFFAIYVFHLPPLFFPGKEALLIIIDEIDRKSVSSNLEERIKLLKEKAENDKYGSQSTQAS